MSALLDNFHFLRPWALLALVPALALWWFGRDAADTTRRWARYMDADLLKALVVGGAAGRRFAPHDLLFAGWIVTALAVAGPTWRQEPSPFADALPPAMIVLKVAPSMTTRDLAPTRLDRARQKLADLLKLRDGGSVGLIAYSGSAHLVLPPTADRDVVLAMAGALSPAIMPREGDRLDEAVGLAEQVLRDGGQGGSILVVADTVASGLKLAPADAPVVFFTMAPERAAQSDKGLQEAVRALDATSVQTTANSDDVQALLRPLARTAALPTVLGEAQRWQETGYWLCPLIVLLALGWFRRGWVIST